MHEELSGEPFLCVQFACLWDSELLDRSLSYRVVSFSSAEGQLGFSL